MRVAILKDNMSIRSGTGKMCVRIASGFRACGDDVKVIFFRKSDDWSQIPQYLKPIRFTVLSHPVLSALSTIIQAPLLKLILSPSFTIDNRIDFIGSADSRRISREIGNVDLLIFMNLWSAPSLLLGIAESGARVITLIHEPPIFDNLPYPLDRLLEEYFRFLSRASHLLVSSTEDTAQYTRKHFGSEVLVVPVASWIPPLESLKEPLVLADTRWTEDRDPQFLIRVAEKVEDANFVISGNFPSKRTRRLFMKELDSTGLRSRVTVLENPDEATVENTYSRALIYVRWGILTREFGPSFGLFQAISNLCVPIVSSDLGSASYLRDSVHRDLVVDKNPSSFAQTINRVLHDGAFRETIQSAVRGARNRYTWKEYAEVLRASALR